MSLLTLTIVPGGSKVKNLPAIWETWVQSLGWEDPLEKGMATHSNSLAWRIPMDGEAWQATVHGVAESGRTEQISTPGPLGDLGLVGMFGEVNEETSI